MESTADKHWRKLGILILAHFYPPEMGGAAARIHGLARWLVKFGHHVTVITGFPNYPSGVIPVQYRRKSRKFERRDDVEVIRTWVHASSHHTLWGRISNYFSFVISCIITASSVKSKYDVVLTSSPPLVVGLAGLFVSTLRRIPLAFDVRDIWPDVAVDAGVFKPNGIMTRLGKKLAAFLYSRSDHITPVTQVKYRKILAEGIEPGKVTVVQNGVDFDLLDGSTPELWHQDLDLGNRFTAVYAGLIGIAQGVGVVVEAANFLKKNRGIHFLIVGDGVERKGLIKRAQNLKLENITFVESQRREIIPSILALADLALVPLVSKNLVDAVPSKLMEAWACRKPVLLAACGEPAELVKLADGGMVIPPQEPQRMAEAVEQLSESPDVLKHYADNGYALVRAHYDRRDLARMMEHVLTKVSRK